MHCCDLAAADIKAKRAACESVKESVEILHTAEYPEFLRHFFGPLVGLLANSQPQFEDSEAAKLRHTALEVLARLPHNEAFKPHAPKLAELCVHIMRGDNQMNAIVSGGARHKGRAGAAHTGTPHGMRCERRAASLQWGLCPPASHPCDTTISLHAGPDTPLYTSRGHKCARIALHDEPTTAGRSAPLWLAGGGQHLQRAAPQLPQHVRATVRWLLRVRAAGRSPGALPGSNAAQAPPCHPVQAARPAGCRGSSGAGVPAAQCTLLARRLEVVAV